MQLRSVINRIRKALARASFKSSKRYFPTKLDSFFQPNSVNRSRRQPVRDGGDQSYEYEYA